MVLKVKRAYFSSDANQAAAHDLSQKPELSHLKSDSGSSATSLTTECLLWDTLKEACNVESFEDLFRLYHSTTTTWGRLPGFTMTSNLCLGNSIQNAGENKYAHVISFFLVQGMGITEDILRAVQVSYSTEMYQVLLDHGWDINSKHRGITSLHRNVTNEELVRWLLLHGADPSIKSSCGYTALEHAAGLAPLSVIKLLVEFGIDMSETTALHWAARYSVHPGRLEVMEYLLDHGVNVDQLETVLPDAKPREIAEVACFVGTALHRAMESRNEEKVLLLLKRGAERELRGTLGLTPFEVVERLRLDNFAAMLRKD